MLYDIVILLYPYHKLLDIYNLLLTDKALSQYYRQEYIWKYFTERQFTNLTKVKPHITASIKKEKTVRADQKNAMHNVHITIVFFDATSPTETSRGVSKSNKFPACICCRESVARITKKLKIKRFITNSGHSELTGITSICGGRRLTTATVSKTLKLTAGFTVAYL